MVLFSEHETMLLLDLYLHFRSNPQNLTSGGVLLKMHARDELTRAMNKCFKRDTPWTESQVTVKFKNLRSEYIELKWLTDQPGFQLDGKGMSDEWWGEIKAARPKVHAFKGKLPWPYYRKMAVIVGDMHATNNMTDSRNVQRVSQLLNELAADAQVTGTTIAAAAAKNGTSANGSDDATPYARAQAQYQALQQQIPSFSTQGTAKRLRDGSSSSKRPRKRLSDLTDYERERQQSLVKSVEHGSKAAADMAKGFNDLVSVFQRQSSKCAQVADESGVEATSTTDEHQILASLAISLEKSAQATAEMAKGYRDLVSFFIQESEITTSCTV